jgi:hypothetical protein
MPIDDVLTENTNLAEIRRQQERKRLMEDMQGQQASGQAPNQKAQAQAQIPGGSGAMSVFGPLMNAEKTDLQLWTQIGIFVMLFLIWRDL